MQGCSGSGKSTLAITLANRSNQPSVILSTDDYFYYTHHDPPTPTCVPSSSTRAALYPNKQQQEYHFLPHHLARAHTWNQERTAYAMSLSIPLIIIDNTFTQKWEARPYAEMALYHQYEFHVQEPTTEWWLKRDCMELARRNIHQVGRDKIELMLERWESDFTLERILDSERVK